MTEPVQLLKRHGKSMRVYVVGGGFQYIRMFYDEGAIGARSIEDADLICFTGGSDVNPDLYNQKLHPQTHIDERRDAFEVNLYWEAVGYEKPMVGICRGGQFLNVMNHGTLWQHVNNHCVPRHDVIDVETGDTVMDMTSTHHQMMIPHADAELLAVAAMATSKESDTKKEVRDAPEYDDAEALWYPKTRSLCFQPHPEFYAGRCRDYFMTLVKRHIIPTL